MNQDKFINCVEKANINFNIENVRAILLNPNGKEEEEACIRRCIYMQLKFIGDDFNINVRF